MYTVFLCEKYPDGLCSLERWEYSIKSTVHNTDKDLFAVNMMTQGDLCIAYIIQGVDKQCSGQRNQDRKLLSTPRVSVFRQNNCIYVSAV